MATQLDGVVNARPSPRGAVKVGTPGSGMQHQVRRPDAPGYAVQGGLAQPPLSAPRVRPRRA